MDAANRRLGRAGEEWVYQLERRRLRDAGRPDLARRVTWAADTEGDGLGYDVRSFEADGSEAWIEVKTTNAGKSAPFLLTPNELAVWRAAVERYRLYRVYSFAGDAHFYQLRGAPDDVMELTTALWEARPS